MTKQKIIGIDPDLRKSGFAVYDQELDMLTECSTLPMWTLFEMILNNKSEFFRLEYPENTNTYHLGGKGAALNVGKNQAIAIVIADFLEANKIEHEKIKPSGYSKVFHNATRFKLVTKFKGQTNEDGRAAAAMCFKYKK